jgi:5'-deoxynucleotidase YfbR-like HD superfamily hydrolase
VDNQKLEIENVFSTEGRTLKEGDYLKLNHLLNHPDAVLNPDIYRVSLVTNNDIYLTATTPTKNQYPCSIIPKNDAKTWKKFLFLKLKTKSGKFLTTFSGTNVYLDKINPNTINIEDIAHALSNICRFNGHTKDFYSVAQHSVLVSQYCPLELKIIGLLHDASEAYLCDVPSPLKHSDYFIDYADLEEKFTKIILRKFSVFSTIPSEVKEIDEILLHTECRDLMNNCSWLKKDAKTLDEKIIPLPPKEAKQLFLETFNKLQWLT